MINRPLLNLFFFTKIYFKSLPKKIILENYNLVRGIAILEIMYCDCLHDSLGSRVSISSYRNGPNCAQNAKFFSFKLGMFLEKLGKRRIFWMGNRDDNRTLVIGKKGPARLNVAKGLLTV